MSETKQNDNGVRTNMRLLILLAIAVFTFWLIAWLVLLFGFSSWSERGQFGDMFGAVNSLFSGLAFAGVIFTIYLQREELSLQRKELSLTRTQLSRSADAQEKSEQALTHQATALRQSALLSALNSIIEHYDIKIQREPRASEKLAAQRQQLEYIARLEQELHGLSELI